MFITSKNDFKGFSPTNHQLFFFRNVVFVFFCFDRTVDGLGCFFDNF